MDPIHPYERLPLFGTGLTMALVLIAVHLAMLVKPQPVKDFLSKLPRNQTLGQVLLALGMAWFWLLVAPDGWGHLSMELGEFDSAKPILWWATPVALFLVAFSVRDFLAVRALGVLGLMVAAPLLSAAFLKEPQSRLLIPIYCYVLITASLFCVGMPYLFRDFVNWATAKSSRWTALCAAGLVYGVAMLACAFLFWRGA